MANVSKGSQTNQNDSGGLFYYVFLLLVILSSVCCTTLHTTDYRKTIANSSVFKIEVISVEDGAWSGTAWLVQKTDKFSYVMTAGHVCEEGPDVVYSLFSKDNVESTATRVVLDDDDLDLCLLEVPGNIGNPLAIASKDPEYGDNGFYIGAPNGIWGNGVAPMYLVHFIGRGTVFGFGNEALAFSTEGAMGGASGSPIIFNNQVVALLTLVPPKFQSITSGVPYNSIKSFLERANRFIQK